MKIATRASKLAMAQSTIVVENLRKLFPHIDFELVPIVTRGDQNTQKALQNLEGKDFFVKELDDALIRGFVDASIHSFKDLSLERPSEICLAAVPERSFLQDVVFFNPESVRRMRSGVEVEIKVGSSAPRRKELLLPFLKNFLPLHPDSRIKMVDIRGNIDTRLSKLKPSTESGLSSELDAVVLAMAGIERLFGSTFMDASTEEILNSFPFVLVPLEECPGAPAQGALAIECRHGDHESKKILGALHHEESFLGVQAEREVLKSWGGGCHLSLGASMVKYSNNSRMLYIRGRHPNGAFVQENRLARSPEGLARSPKTADSVPAFFWDGRQVQPKRQTLEECQVDLGSIKTVFLSHPFVLENKKLSDSLKDFSGFVFTSGTSTWREAVKKGLWVSGSAESRGGRFFQRLLLRARFFRGKLGAKWVNLTHEGVEKGDGSFHNVACYESTFEWSSTDVLEIKNNLAKATHIFWASRKQFELLHQSASVHAIHASRPGKTFDVVSALYPERSIAIPNSEEWETWLTQKKITP